jgi:DNA-directed RNA polymerase specialized sigma24 family protein
MTLERSSTDREAAGYVFVALENQLQDLIRAASPRRRLHRRLAEALKSGTTDGLQVDRTGARAVLKWSGDRHVTRPERLDDLEGRFRSDLVVQAACHFLVEIERPIEIGELVDILADAYGVPESDAEVVSMPAVDAVASSRHAGRVRDDVAEAVLSFRAELPAKDREILDLYVSCLPMSEIARTTGKAKSTISQAIDKRLIPALRARLEPLVESTQSVRAAMALLEATADGAVCKPRGGK